MYLYRCGGVWSGVSVVFLNDNISISLRYATFIPNESNIWYIHIHVSYDPHSQNCQFIMKTPSPPVFEINMQQTLILTLLIFFELKEHSSRWFLGIFLYMNVDIVVPSWKKYYQCLKCLQDCSFSLSFCWSGYVSSALSEDSLI